jgi:hypothetical protein
LRIIFMLASIMAGLAAIAAIMSAGGAPPAPAPAPPIIEASAAMSGPAAAAGPLRPLLCAAAGTVALPLPPPKAPLPMDAAMLCIRARSSGDW